MIEELIKEYIACAQGMTTVDYADKDSVRRFNAMSDRMREIADEIVSLGPDAVERFASLLDQEPAATSAAIHLVEKAQLDSATLARCFARVEQGKQDAEAKGDGADALGLEWWLKEWRAKKAN